MDTAQVIQYSADRDSTPPATSSALPPAPAPAIRASIASPEGEPRPQAQTIVNHSRYRFATDPPLGTRAAATDSRPTQPMVGTVTVAGDAKQSTRAAATDSRPVQPIEGTVTVTGDTKPSSAKASHSFSAKARTPTLKQTPTQPQTPAQGHTHELGENDSEQRGDQPKSKATVTAGHLLNNLKQAPRLPKDCEFPNRESQLQVLRWLKMLMANARFRKYNGLDRVRRCANCRQGSSCAKAKCTLLTYDDVNSMLVKQKGLCESCQRRLHLDALHCTDDAVSLYQPNPEALHICSFDHEACVTQANFHCLLCAGCAAVYALCDHSFKLFERYRHILFARDKITAFYAYGSTTNDRAIVKALNAQTLFAKQCAGQLGFCVYPKPPFADGMRTFTSDTTATASGVVDRDVASPVTANGKGSDTAMDDKEPGADWLCQMDLDSSHTPFGANGNITCQPNDQNRGRYKRKRKRQCFDDELDEDDENDHMLSSSSQCANYAQDPRYIMFYIPLDVRPRSRGKSLLSATPASATLDRVPATPHQFLLTTRLFSLMEDQFGFNAFMHWALRRLNWYQQPDFVPPSAQSIWNGDQKQNSQRGSDGGSEGKSDGKDNSASGADRAIAGPSRWREIQLTPTEHSELTKLRDILLQLRKHVNAGPTLDSEKRAELRTHRDDIISSWKDKLLLAYEADLDIQGCLKRYQLKMRFRTRSASGARDTPGGDRAVRDNVTERTVAQLLPKLLCRFGLGFNQPLAGSATKITDCMLAEIATNQHCPSSPTPSTSVSGAVPVCPKAAEANGLVPDQKLVTVAADITRALFSSPCRLYEPSPIATTRDVTLILRESSRDSVKTRDAEDGVGGNTLPLAGLPFQFGSGHGHVTVGAL